MCLNLPYLKFTNIINIAKTMKNHLFNMHHKIKLKLDAICQEAGDMNVEEFMQVYEYLQTDDESIDDKEIILMQSKRINELKTNIEQLETFELDNIELKNAIKLAHERIKELEEQIQSMLDNYGN